jgi:peptidoglycan-associated lipoprotein
MIVALVFIIPGLMVTASCSKKKIKPDEVIGAQDMTPRQTPATSERDRQARQQAIEEERLRQERLKKEQEERIGREQASRDVVSERQSFVEEDVYFAYDSAALSMEAQSVLREKAEWLRVNPNISVIIEGHCDERGTNAYNMALGDRRAESAKSFLVNLGVSPSRLTTISYGEERPLDPGHNDFAWSKNRRAHFVLE